MNSKYNDDAIDAVWNRHSNNKRYKMYLDLQKRRARNSGDLYSYSMTQNWYDLPPPLMPSPSNRFSSRVSYALLWASITIQKYTRVMLRHNFLYTKISIINQLKTNNHSKRGSIGDLNQRLKILIIIRKTFKFLPTEIVDKIAMLVSY